MTIHIGYDREEDKIELILPSQGNVISTLIGIQIFDISGGQKLHFRTILLLQNSRFCQN